MGKFNLFLPNDKKRCLQILVKIKMAAFAAIFYRKTGCFI